MAKSRSGDKVLLEVHAEKVLRALIPCGVPLPDAITQFGLAVEQPCGGRGTCGKCSVRFISNPPPVTPEELALLTTAQLESGWRLSCRHTVELPAAIEVPQQSRWIGYKDFGPSGSLSIECPRVKVVAIHGPSLEELKRSGSWEEWLCAQAERDGVTTLQLTNRARSELANLSRTTADSLYLVVLDNSYVLSVSPTPVDKLIGLVLDLGTTTLAAGLVDLATGVVFDSCTEKNPQARYGSDVIARIAYAQSPSQTDLHNVLLQAVERLVSRLLRRTGIDLAHVYLASAVGNSFMLHTFCGIPPFSLGTAPYAPVWRKQVIADAAALGFSWLRNLIFSLPPLLGSHVGGDAAAAIVALDLDRSKGPSLLVDLGTNCELVLASSDRILVTSAAAGPAFEGGNITCGVAAGPGALDRVALDANGDLWFHTIGRAPLRGICGVGLVDLVSLLLQVGLIDESGRLRSPDEALPASIPALLASRLFLTDQGEPAFKISQGTQGQAVYLTASDVRQLQLVKCSIRAGISVLLDKAGVSPQDLHAVYITGQLGAYLKKPSLLRLGLVPPIKPGRIHIVPNAAGWGSRRILVDHASWHRVCQLLTVVEHIDLASHPFYAEWFASAMRFEANAS
jgi:uncharacterized 2Fe-2S/4Fe-4S cluster protein (DUF4445 family)